MKNTIEWIFFDLGSTLIDAKEVQKKIIETIAKQQKRSSASMFLETTTLYKEKLNGIEELKKKYNAENVKWDSSLEKVYPGVTPVLSKLHKHYKLGIISNTTKTIVDRLQQWEILRYFDLVVVSEEAKVEKPSKAIYEYALKKAKCEPKNAVMVGDSVIEDILPAKKLGMHTVWVQQGYHAYYPITSEEETADITVSDIKKLVSEFVD